MESLIAGVFDMGCPDHPWQLCVALFGGHAFLLSQTLHTLV